MNPLFRKFLVACVVTLLSIILTQEVVLQLGVLHRLELASLDYRFQSRSSQRSNRESTHVVIVEVNDESFKSLPVRWPWPRSYYAHLVRNLKAAGARAVGIDIILNDADTYSFRNDQQLREAIHETGIVVLAGKMAVQNDRYESISQNEHFGNIFYGVDSAIGIVNIRNDVDGVYRRYSPYGEATHIGQNDTIRVPMFGFAVLNKYFDVPPSTVAENQRDAFVYAGREIPKYDPASFLINFVGPSGTFRHIKFVDVIDDETMTTTEESATGEQINTFSDSSFGYLHDGTFKDKIVLVGSTSPEEHDLFPVSISKGSQQGDNLMYGVQIHANVIESILQRNFLTRQSAFTEILVIVLLSFLTFYGASALRSGRSKRHFILEMYGVLFILFEFVVIAGAAVWLFTNKNIVMATVSPVVAVLGGYIASTAYNFVTERKQRLMIKSMFSTYVNPAVVDELIANPSKLKLGGERKELTVLFSDIDGFTTFSEQMESDRLVAFLNEYFNEMAGIVLNNDGTLDKFFGDAIIAFWGAPLPHSDHALRACTAALEMQQRLAHVRVRWQEEGKPFIRTRIGINTGEMVVGNMGGSEKFDYTVIGDSVNIASRLEGANKIYHTGIMVSEATYEAVKHNILGRELDLLSVKGRTEPVRTFELLQSMDGAIDSDLEKFLAAYSAGLKQYRARKWEEAEKSFRTALAYHGADYPSQLYIERAGYFRLNQPPDGWTGVFEMTSK